MKYKGLVLLYIALTLLLGVSVFADSMTLLQTDPAPVRAGDYADITVRYETYVEGNDMNNVELVVASNPTFSAQSTEIIGTVFAGDTITRTIRVYVSESTPQGTVILPISVMSDSATSTFELEVYVQESDVLPELLIGSVKTVPNELLPDTADNVLTFTVQNLGDKDADLVKATLLVADESVTPSYSFSDMASISSIAAGGEGKFEFTIDLSEDARGEIPARLQLNYRAKDATNTNYDTYMTSIQFDLPIVDAPLLFVSDVEHVSDFTQGSADNILRVTLTNNGEDDADDVRVRAVPDISYPFVFQTTSQYVTSKIKPGESATVEFIIEVSGDAQVRDYPTTVKLESLAGETRYSREDSFTISVSEGVKASNGGLAITIIVVILIVSAIIGVRMYLNRK